MDFFICCCKFRIPIWDFTVSGVLDVMHGPTVYLPKIYTSLKVHAFWMSYVAFLVLLCPSLLSRSQWFYSVKHQARLTKVSKEFDGGSQYVLGSGFDYVREYYKRYLTKVDAWSVLAILVWEYLCATLLCLIFAVLNQWFASMYFMLRRLFSARFSCWTHG